MNNFLFILGSFEAFPVHCCQRWGCLWRFKASIFSLCTMYQPIPACCAEVTKMTSSPSDRQCQVCWHHYFVMFSVLIHIEESTAPLLRKANIWRVELSSNTALIKMGNETVCSEVFGCLSLVGLSWVLLTWISTVCSAKGTCMYPEHEKEVAC